MAEDWWIFLSASPLFWLTLTIGIFVGASRLARASRNHPLINPVLISMAVIALVLGLTGTAYADYFAGARYIHFLLGPATVALAIPLWRNRAAIRRLALPIAAALAIGVPFAMGFTLALARLLGLPDIVQLSLIPKSATAGIAVGVAQTIGASASLTAVLVILTGIVGAVAVTPLMDAMGIKDYAARGFAAGLTSHGIGTARAFQVSPLAGTFAGLAMALGGLMTAALAGWLFG